MSMSIEDRLTGALGNRLPESLWTALMQLYAADRETFYDLAVNGVASSHDVALVQLASLASFVRRAVTTSFTVVQRIDGCFVTTRNGEEREIRESEKTAVTDFLHELTGSRSGGRPGRDYEGVAASELEVDFKLGDEKTAARERVMFEHINTRRARVLKVSSEEVSHLASQPNYVTFGLHNCVPPTVLAPTSVFRGLRRGEGAPLSVHNGWAIFGKPRRLIDNDGARLPPPTGMLYAVYADEGGFIFDWDWVQENPDELGYPLDWRLRFEEPVSVPEEFAFQAPEEIGAPRFDPNTACYSRKGDCIFCYINDVPSYAARINSDLTVFRSLSGVEVTGFKVKNLRRILERDRSVVLQGDPGLRVTVDSVLLASARMNPETATHQYLILIRALLRRVQEPPFVTVPKDVVAT